MNSKVNRFSSMGIGIIVGIALVVSCGDKMQPSAAQQDMSTSGTGGGPGAGNCGGSCTVAGPIAVSSVGQPVAITTSQPIPVSGSVAVSGPVAISAIASAVTVAGPVKVITADTDANQLKSGYFGTTGATLLLLSKGPFVITDVQLDGGALSSFTASVYIEPGSTCPSSVTPKLVVTPSTPLHGARLFVPAGYVACGNGSYAMFSGFALY